uniref:Hexosyltransferase n=2 Tax=Ciona intestinalis TaxID=7719 RepID=H2XQ46_CIOIN
MSRKYKYNSRTTTPGHKTTERRKVASLARRSHTLFVIIVAFASVVTYMTARMLRHERRSVQLYMRVADGAVFLENVRPREVFREIETELADMHKIDVQDKYTVKKMKSPIQFPRVILQNITSAAEMIISPPTSLCKKTHIYFMILIFSEESKAPLRDIIRKTWCKQNKHRNNSVSTCVFVVGKSNSDENNFAKAVTAESKKHGDIMLMPFLDDVRNSSLKLITAFKWLRTNCPNVNYVMRTQDDVIVNTNKLMSTVLTSAPATRFVAGKCQDATPPIRNAYSKFYVPEDLYPHAKYPPVCSNMGYIMSGDVIEILYAESFKHMTIPLDDVFIGVMLEAVKIVPQNMNRLIYTKSIRQTERTSRYKICSHSILHIHIDTVASARKIWQVMRDKCNGA